jgi:hypothetical protein
VLKPLHAGCGRDSSRSFTEVLHPGPMCRDRPALNRLETLQPFTRHFHDKVNMSASPAHRGIMGQPASGAAAPDSQWR